MTRRAIPIWIISLLTAATFGIWASAAEPAGVARYREHVQPILENYCYGCHGYGESEGGRTLDEFASDEAMLGNVDLWWAVLKNVRAGLMPPAGEDRPSDAERKQIVEWIKTDVFGVDPADPDPGHVTLRRLNRVEYHNTIHDLMGVDFNTNENFPPDDSGYGFDNVGDALTMSPMLMEKYMQAAETIVAKAVPMVSKVVAERSVDGGEFASDDGSIHGKEMSFYEPAKVSGKLKIEKPAKYRLVIEARIDGYYELDPGKCEVTCEFDGRQLFKNEYEWRDDLPLKYEFEEQLDAGEYGVSFELMPLVPAEEKIKYLNYRVGQIRIQGPLDEADWVPPKNYKRFFPDGPPPDVEPARGDYARRVLRDFTTRAFRRPVDDDTLDRLTALTKGVYEQPNRSFEQGIAQAMTAVLSSPRFLFRVEESGPTPPGAKNPLVDEYALASRLSYFLWSTMPDKELMELASRGELRDNLDAQVKRMLADSRSKELVENFTGQWLQSRDVETTAVDPVAALGHQKEWEALLTRMREIRGKARGERRRKQEAEKEKQAEPNGEEKSSDDKDKSPAEQEKAAAQEKLDAERKQVFAEMQKYRELREKFSGDVRWAMRRETELSFDYVLRENRSVLELVDSDYTFLNQKLAEFYGIPGVEGNEIRRVTLPADSPRGGILTQGTVLVVTSNPTRTSPVKRGLFVLDNVLGTPAPPPPKAVPPLEASAEEVDGHEPTLREALGRHRSDPLCAACHARMDPLGLALENFNALGQWRDDDHGQALDTAGTLITGEQFHDIRELKKVLKTDHRLDFYRCLTEKLLTYALGRGLEYYDEYTVDQIVDTLDQNDGRFAVLLGGIIQSAPFQRQRPVTEATTAADVGARGDGPEIAQRSLP